MYLFIYFESVLWNLDTLYYRMKEREKERKKEKKELLVAFLFAPPFAFFVVLYAVPLLFAPTFSLCRPQGQLSLFRLPQDASVQHILYADLNFCGYKNCTS